MPDRVTLILGFEISLIVAGLILLWRVVLLPNVRRQPPAPAALEPWGATIGDFFLYLWLVVVGAFVGVFASGQLCKALVFSTDMKAALITGAGQLGAVAGMVVFHGFFDKHRPPPHPARNPHFLLTGAATFLIAMPVVSVVMLLWQGLLRLCHVTPEPQDLLRMFSEADSMKFLVVMSVLACIGAPVTEELVFRRGIFRYVRTRLPRWAALLIPAVLFSVMHGYLATFAPLIVLGVIFSLAYERTGNIKTTMVAHALFNLNSIVLILAGANV